MTGTTVFGLSDFAGIQWKDSHHCRLKKQKQELHVKTFPFK